MHSSKTKNNSKAYGFTLIEVVVATFIVGLALVALANTVQAITYNQSTQSTKYFASLIASNKMAELHVLPDWPELGESDDKVEMANREWFIDIEVTETAVESLRRVDIKTGIDDDRRLTESQLTGFVSSSPHIRAGKVNWTQSSSPTGTSIGDEDPPPADEDEESTPLNP